jgi:hypothetical protein
LPIGPPGLVGTVDSGEDVLRITGSAGDRPRRNR